MERDSGIGAELWSWKPQDQKPRVPELEEEGVRLDVVDVSYSLNIDGKMRQLLRNVSFQLNPGELCALMGSSGAGKR